MKRNKIWHVPEMQTVPFVVIVAEPEDLKLSLPLSEEALVCLAQRYRALGLEARILAGSELAYKMVYAGYSILPRHFVLPVMEDIRSQLGQHSALLLHSALFPFVRTSTVRLLLQYKNQSIRPKQDGWPLLVAPHDTSIELVETADDAVTASLNDFSLEEGQKQFPETRLSRQEALRLLELYAVPAKGIAHAEAVGKVASAFAQYAGCDSELAGAAGLVHDIAKSFRKHELTGAALLEWLGLSDLAHCIRDHRDLVLAEDAPVTERELVYLADKYCYGPRFVPLEQRFGQKMELFADSRQAVAAVKRRLGHAQALEARLTRAFGKNPEAIAEEALRLEGK